MDHQGTLLMTSCRHLFFHRSLSTAPKYPLTLHSKLQSIVLELMNPQEVVAGTSGYPMSEYEYFRMHEALFRPRRLADSACSSSCQRSGLMENTWEKVAKAVPVFSNEAFNSALQSPAEVPPKSISI